MFYYNSENKIRDVYFDMRDAYNTPVDLLNDLKQTFVNV